MIVNAALEDETHYSGANDDPAAAQNLDESPLPVSDAGGSAGRAVVRGVTDSCRTYPHTQARRHGVHHPNELVFDFAGAPQPTGDGVLRVSSTADLRHGGVPRAAVIELICDRSSVPAGQPCDLTCRRGARGRRDSPPAETDCPAIGRLTRMRTYYSAPLRYVMRQCD